jgi:hypothetical protein
MKDGWKKPIIKMMIRGKPIDVSKSKIGKPHHVDMFWDRHSKTWVLTIKDKNGFQIGDAAYESNKKRAMELKQELEGEYKIPSKPKRGVK